jgi:hypothetical protein
MILITFTCWLYPVDIFPQDVLLRLRFVTTAMHAYGHEWTCQLVHNPRMCIGMGLSDGEGTEQLWLRFIRLIGVERSSLVRYTISYTTAIFRLIDQNREFSHKRLCLLVG